MTIRRAITVRDYLVTTARRGGWKVRHRRYGAEVTALADGRVALVTWPTAEAAVIAIGETYRDPAPAECALGAES